MGPFTACYGHYICVQDYFGNDSHCGLLSLLLIFFNNICSCLNSSTASMLWMANILNTWNSFICRSNIERTRITERTCHLKPRLFGIQFGNFIFEALQQFSSLATTETLASRIFWNIEPINHVTSKSKESFQVSRQAIDAASAMQLATKLQSSKATESTKVVNIYI